MQTLANPDTFILCVFVLICHLAVVVYLIEVSLHKTYWLYLKQFKDAVVNPWFAH